MVKVQRLFAKTNLKFQFATLVPSRVRGRHAPTRSRPKGARMGTADDFLDRYAALPSAERNSAGVRPPERIAAPLRIVSADPAPPELLDEAGGGPFRPVPAVPELPLEQAEEAPRRRVVRAAALGGLDWLHRCGQLREGRKRREGRVRVPTRGPRGGAAWVRRLSTRSTSLMTGSYSISTSRMMQNGHP